MARLTKGGFRLLRTQNGLMKGNFVVRQTEGSCSKAAVGPW